MAVQAQFPLNNFSILNDLWDDNQVHFQQQPGPNPLDCYQNLVGAGILNGTTVFSEPESELTCNISGNCKRGRDFDMLETPFKAQQLQGHKAIELDHFVSGGNMQSFPESKMLQDDSGQTSTSGMGCQDIDSYVFNQNLKMEDLVRYENQKLFAMVDQLRKKHCMSLLGMIEQKTLRKLQEKENALVRVMKANMELEEKVKRMSAENQMWFNVAKNSEATVSSLRLSLEQILQQNAAGNQRIEGFGETDGLTDDAQSTCYGVDRDESLRRLNVEMKQQMGCKLCGGCEVSFLVLPCRHLCLCKNCESKVYSCPVCNTVKKSTLQVFLT